MRMELSQPGQVRLEDVIEQLHTCFDMEHVGPQELIEALIELGADLITSDEGTLIPARARLLDRLSAGERAQTF